MVQLSSSALGLGKGPREGAGVPSSWGHPHPWSFPVLLGGITSDCCFTYTSRQIPRSLVTDYFVTSSMCAQPAVVFITKKERKICTNPKDAWVQEYVNDLKYRVSGDRQW
uniref:C-C motif chemokine n=1 Tax=Gopherus evgoodei TaxID=1825980 RepID=A0A8C4Y785_9SAUR